MKVRLHFDWGTWLIGFTAYRMEPGNFLCIWLHLPCVYARIEFPGRTSWRYRSIGEVLEERRSLAAALGHPAAVADEESRP